MYIYAGQWLNEVELKMNEQPLVVELPKHGIYIVFPEPLTHS